MNSLKSSISTRTGAVKLTLAVVISLIVLKVVVSVLSRSISISAQAADSLLDLFSTGVTFIAVRMSVAPADETHPFGHGKFEGFAALIQAVLVLGAGGYIIYSAVQRMIHSTPIQPDEGMAVMGISIVASFLLSRHLRKVAKSTGSLAVEASARNISADVYSAAGVLLGLLLVRLTNLVILDPIVALIMAGFVLAAGFGVLKGAFRELIDYRLPKEDLMWLDQYLSSLAPTVRSFHRLRTRKAGAARFVDMHVVVDPQMSVEESHAITERIEADIRSRFPNTSVVVHIEPCDGTCDEACTEGCLLSEESQQAVRASAGRGHQA